MESSLDPFRQLSVRLSLWEEEQGVIFAWKNGWKYLRNGLVDSLLLHPQQICLLLTYYGQVILTEDVHAKLIAKVKQQLQTSLAFWPHLTTYWTPLSEGKLPPHVWTWEKIALEGLIRGIWNESNLDVCHLIMIYLSLKTEEEWSHNCLSAEDVTDMNKRILRDTNYQHQFVMRDGLCYLWRQGKLHHPTDFYSRQKAKTLVFKNGRSSCSERVHNVS